MSRVRIAMAQMNALVGDIDGNVRKIEAGIRRAREMGADLALFPEMSIPGYPPEDLLLKPSFLRANLDAARSIAGATVGITAVVGFADVEGDVFNAAAIFHDGQWAHTYRKHYLPNYGVFDEDRYFQVGTDIGVLRRGDVTFGVSICEDI
ncbi:MAG: nitrilase-related carbon-nitrogen hydrolase, partial [Anaerolineae bacterium]